MRSLENKELKSLREKPWKTNDNAVHRPEGSHAPFSRQCPEEARWRATAPCAGEAVGLRELQIVKM